MFFRLNSEKHNKVFNGFALFISMAMLVVMLFSAFYITLEATHDCDGDSCPVCAMIQQCENNLNQIGSGLILVAVITGIAYLLSVCVKKADGFFMYPTLVSNMVRLNN